MDIKNKMNTRSKFEIFLGAILLIGFAFCVFTSVSSENGVVLVSEDEYALIERYKRLDEVRELLQDEYYEELDEDDLILGAIDGMLAATDDIYTYYYTPSEMEQSNEENEGQYEGYGMVLYADKDGVITLARVYEESPAFDAGVQAYDCLIKVNGEAVSGATEKELNEALENIRLLQGSVDFTFLRGEEEYTVSMVKRHITVKRVSCKMLDDEIGYIQLTEFTGNCVSEMEDARNQLIAENAKAVILDLRDNPGGTLDDVLAIADMLIPEGTILTIVDRYGNTEPYSADDEYWDIPIVVLVNGASASASEVLSAAIQDSGRGILIGKQTFGKGIVQCLFPFEEDGAGVQMTVAKYYTPSGECIHGVGITPDIESEEPLEDAQEYLKNHIQ